MRRDKSTFILSAEYESFTEDMTDAEAGKLFKAILRHENGGEVGDVPAEIRLAWSFIRKRLDANKAAYDAACEAHKEARTNGNKTEQKEQKVTKGTKGNKTDKTEQNGIDNDNENDNENDKDNDKDSVSKERAHDPKHIYGEYKHVKLTDQEYSKLTDEYGEPDTQAAITFLDEYIEEKGYKSKSHYLAMKKWVFNAVNERRDRTARSGTINNNESWAAAYEEVMNDRERDNTDFNGDQYHVSAV